MTTYEIRVSNLKRLIDQWGGPTSLAKKLKHSNGSFLSHLAGPRPSRDISERTARKIEKQLNLPHGWLDQRQDGEIASKNGTGTESAPTPGKMPMSGSAHNSNTAAVLDIDKLATCVTAVTAACESTGIQPTPEKFGDLVSLAYAASLAGDQLQQYAKRLVQLTSR